MIWFQSYQGTSWLAAILHTSVLLGAFGNAGYVSFEQLHSFIGNVDAELAFFVPRSRKVLFGLLR